MNNNAIDYWYQKYLSSKLTWEDVAAIDNIIMDVNNEFAIDGSKKFDRKIFYETILTKFNKFKQNNNK